MSTITYTELESRSVLIDLLGDVTSQAQLCRNLGRHLSGRQREQIDLLIGVAQSLKKSLIVADDQEGSR